MNEPKILVSMARLQSGVFGNEPGDIYRALSCTALCEKKFPAPKVRTFTHDGKTWTNTGGGGGNWQEQTYYCHELIPADQFTGPESEPYSHAGQTVTVKGKLFRLGRKTHFEGFRTVPEHRQQLRRMYEHGGMFTSGHTYHSMLREMLDKEKWNRETQRFEPCSGPPAEAIALELAETKDWSKWSPEDLQKQRDYQQECLKPLPAAPVIGQLEFALA